MLADQRIVRRHRGRDSWSWRRGVGPAGGWLTAGAFGQSGGLGEDTRACVSWQAVFAVTTMQQLGVLCGVSCDVRYQTAGTQV